ncbi:MAG: hypothetical protein PHF86_14830 [Candidatus Nanoarchaeia archaeon]|jgi:hypothetical protein|nr:hypothetical protein [Candidatus Nanoarchaeia archaeon]
MPYIKVADRSKYDNVLCNMPVFANKGEMEYCIFVLMKQYMRHRENRYTHLHDCTYAVQHCADEFRRRYLDIRENEAIIENGDV